MKAEDGVKLCYQSEFGGGHLLPQRDIVVDYISQERVEACPLSDEVHLLEDIGGGLCRMHLNSLDAKNLHSETIAGLFQAVSEKARGTMAGFLTKVDVLKELCIQGSMPFSPMELDAFLEKYERQGYPLCRHSDTFRNTYHPAYRLVGRQAKTFLPLLLWLDGQKDQEKPLAIAIDGSSGSGKSSLSVWLQAIYGHCNVFHMDDFFLPQEQKTEERLNTPGGNVDWERFLLEVLTPLQKGNPFSYRPFDCSTGELGEPMKVVPQRLNIIEGVYSHHPALRKAYDLMVFLSIDRAEQSKRILQRNGEYMHSRFINEWIPLEDMYFDQMKIKDKADLIMST